MNQRADTKICETCRSLFPRPADLSHAQWRGRRFCSQQCAAARLRKSQPTKPCERCGLAMTKRPKTTAAQWTHRRFCSPSCYHGGAIAVARVIAGDSKLRPDGYRLLFIPWHPSSNNSYVYEHRVVMERMLGRLLERDEHVHHINGDKGDNRPENLEVIAPREHRVLHGAGLSDEDIARLIRAGRVSREIAACGASTHRIVRVRREIAEGVR